MSTITRELAKLFRKITNSEIDADGNAHVVLSPADSLLINNARIALASLEAEPAIHRWRRVTSEPYGPYPWHYGDFIGFSKPVDGIEDEYFYSAPPVSASAEPLAWLWSHRKHPSEVSLVRPEDDERAEGAHWSGWSCQALYAAPPATVSVPECFKRLLHHAYGMTMGHDWNKGTMAGHHRAKLCHAVDECRAAMLQGAEPVTTAYKLPDAWVACVERMPSAGEQVLAYRPDAPESNDPLIKIATYVGGSAHGHGFDCYCKPTHWMGLPAAPQQEAK